MSDKYLKSEKGITLLTLSIYIVVMLIVLGIVATINTFFYGNLDIVKNSARYSSEFDKINSSLISDVKKNKHVKVDNNNKTIIFEDGTTYKYNASDNGIYRGQNKIAANVTYFTVNKRIIVINNIEKEILTINITIGNSKKSLINKQIDYTLKYW